MSKKLVVIGGGASGFFCAIRAAEMYPDAQITIVEKQHKVLQKVKVSGGGRCNVTHACFKISELVKNYPRGASFLKKSFRHFQPQDVMEWFESRGVSLKIEKDGRVFPQSDSSQSIIDVLLFEIEKRRIQLRLQTEILQIERSKHGFELVTQHQERISCDALFVGSGGHAKAEGFEPIQALGHRIVPPLPSLFTFNLPAHPITAFSGLSVEPVEVKISGTNFKQVGPLLITHWGMSGPAILKLSAFAARELAASQYHQNFIVNWLNTPEHQIREKWPMIRQQKSNQMMGSKNPFELPARLWQYLLSTSEISEDTKWSELPAKEQNKLIHHLTSSEFTLKGKTTYKEEFVTCGGVDLNEVNPDTMESRLHKGLFFGGEILDVDGITGGFNFQHAWTSGYIAGTHIFATST
jgi:predicted Rossmann fold flavoprotein